MGRPAKPPPELPDAANPWAALQRARAAVGLRHARSAESELGRLRDAGIVTGDQYRAALQFVRLRRAVIGWDAPASTLASYSPRPANDPLDCVTEQLYRGALDALGSARRVTTLQRATTPDQPPLTLPDVLDLRAALARLVTYLGTVD